MRWSLRGKVVGLHDTHRTHEIQSRTYCIIAADSLATSDHMQVNETLVPQLASLSPCALHGGSELHTPHDG
jgi:hypothetical protein